MRSPQRAAWPEPRSALPRSAIPALPLEPACTNVQPLGAGCGIIPGHPTPGRHAMAKTDAAKAAAGSAKNLLFVCYLKADALKGMDFFADTQIEPGDQWQAKILEKLAQANAALILISQETLISPFIQQVELRSILESHVSRGLRLFLVPLAPTLFQGSALEKFQWALPPDKPLSSMSESE